MCIFLLASDACDFPHLSPRVLLIVIACISNHMQVCSSKVRLLKAQHLVYYYWEVVFCLHVCL